ncbi:MAG: gamma-glutamyl-gamma-aminobutyrate hydrolase family protein [Planctomycetota bacterium]
MPRPLIAITTDLIDANGLPRIASPRHYADAVLAAGAAPVLLPPMPDLATADELARYDAFILTGGDDPITEPFGEATHDAAVRLKPDRQAFEVELVRLLRRSNDQRPVLGVCLGLQLMALVAGGRLDQHMPDTTPTHADHWDAEHAIEPTDTDLLSPGVVHSRHRQAVVDVGTLRVAARAPDGVIEAAEDPDHPFYLGVQWHPERTPNPALGANLFARLVESARSASTSL